MFAVKTWGELASYDGYGGSVTGVKFGKSASFLVSDMRKVELVHVEDLRLEVFAVYNTSNGVLGGCTEDAGKYVKTVSASLQACLPDEDAPKRGGDAMGAVRSTLQARTYWN